MSETMCYREGNGRFPNPNKGNTGKNTTMGRRLVVATSIMLRRNCMMYTHIRVKLGSL